MIDNIPRAAERRIVDTRAETRQHPIRAAAGRVARLNKDVVDLLEAGFPAQSAQANFSQLGL